MRGAAPGAPRQVLSLPGHRPLTPRTHRGCITPMRGVRPEMLPALTRPQLGRNTTKDQDMEHESHKYDFVADDDLSGCLLGSWATVEEEYAAAVEASVLLAGRNAPKCPAPTPGAFGGGR